MAYRDHRVESAVSSTLIADKTVPFLGVAMWAVRQRKYQ